MNDDIKIMTLYNAAWFWHLIAIIFAVNAVNFLLIENYPWMFGYFIVVFICEVMAFIYTGWFLALGNAGVGLTLLLISMGLAFYVGDLILQKGILQGKASRSKKD